MPSISLAATAALTVLVLPLAAQELCTGPGAAFGVVAYQCSDCTMEQKPGLRPVWQFRAELLILKTAAGSTLQSGDIVEAVNGKAITTAAGGQLFAYPAAGESQVTVRRGGREITLRVRADATCASADAPLAATAKPASAADAAKRHGRFGFAISCSGCTRQVRSDGIGYWTFESSPVIGDVDSDSPAGRSGLHTGDVIIAVDGYPVLQAAGANALARAERAARLQLTVRRNDGTRLTVELKAREAKPGEDDGGELPTQ